MGTKNRDFVLEALEVCDKARKCIIGFGSSWFYRGGWSADPYGRTVPRIASLGISFTAVFFAMVLSGRGGGVMRLKVLGGGRGMTW